MLCDWLIAVYSWGQLIFFLAWCSGGAVGQRPPFCVFMMTYFWCESKVGLFQFLSALKRESYFRLEFLSLPIIAHHLVRQHGFHLGLQAKKDLSFLLNSCLLCMKAWPSSNATQVKWLDSFVKNVPQSSVYIQCKVLLSWKLCWWEGTGSVFISNAVHH